MSPDFHYCTIVPRCTFWIEVLFAHNSVIQSGTCVAQIFTNLEDIKSHWRVYCIEFSRVDKGRFLATEAIVLSISLDY